MPIHEYRCESCGHLMEVLRKRSDPEPTACEECQGGIRKLISAPPVILKGAGFYETEYGRARHNHPDKKGKEGGSSSSSSSGPSTSTSTSSASSTSDSSTSSKPSGSDSSSSSTSGSSGSSTSSSSTSSSSAKKD